MSLRNAFANLVTETVAGAIEQLLTNLEARDAAREDAFQRALLNNQPRNLQYARDSNDQMRVIVGNTYQVVANVSNSTSNLNNASLQRPQWNDPNSVFMVDERYQMIEHSMHTFQSTRARWVIT